MSAAQRARQVWRRKPVDTLLAESEAETTESGGLQRTIGVGRLTMIGVSSTVGTGIFVVLGQTVPQAGPAVLVSFLIAGTVTALTALCYAELVSTIPVSGSSYTYAYATLGEIVAFLVGACLLMGYGVASSAVAVGWGEYLNALLEHTAGWHIPASFSAPPGHGGIVNVPSMVLVGACCLLLIRGTSESATMNAISVVIKLGVLVLFSAVAFTAFSTDNFHPFAPFGTVGIGTAASTVFFSYIGMDILSTAGEEARNPRKTLPLAIMWTLIIVTAIYALVVIAALGAQPVQDFAGQEAVLASILAKVTDAGWPAIILAVGGVVAIFGVTLVNMFGQIRILYAMGRDGMLPPVFHKVHPRTKTPVWNTVIVSSFVAVLAGVLPLDTLVDLTTMGVLVAFTVVSVGVIVLRRTRPELPRGFRVPGYPVVPALSIAACLYLFYGLPGETFWMFAVYAALALAFYFSYSFHRSRLAAGEPIQPVSQRSR
ncbi:amino acid permease [Streptomyces antimycoticus]|uniref:amino acid permease n=1 Tax=Streptomyces antimycoticus TaxID=68175 RepID=UPI000A372B93|nr:amino acid permease [Streptomyces antimycoticus]